MTRSTRPTGWSERQLKTLAAIFATFVEPAYDGESRRHAELAAGALTAVADPADLRQVKLTLSLLGSRLGSRLVAQRPAGRWEGLLDAWSNSRLGQRRTFFQLVKRLACFFAYADPGPDGVNPRWAEMGYAIAPQPTAGNRPIEQAIVQVDRTAADALELEAEIVIVGSGAGGGVAAARLAERGRDVLVVEAGPYVPEDDLPRNELDAFDRLYLDHGLATTTDLGISILAGAAVGGGTLVNWTTCLPPPESLRAEWVREHGLDGFHGRASNEHLDRLRIELEYAGPPNTPAKDQLILDGAAALGWEAAPTTRNAVECGDCGACGFGCPRGAKRSGQRLHLAMAAANGARLLPGAKVDRVEVQAGVASGVRGRLIDDGRAGRPFVIRARTVVIAAGALRTPAVLLRSGLSHPQIGRNLHLHPSVVISARMPIDVLMWRGTTQAARSTEHLRDGVLIESAPGHPGLIALAFPWHGRSEMAELMREARRVAPLVGIVRDRDAGRITITRSGRPRVEYRISRQDAAAARRGLLAMARLARAGGADRLVALGTPSAWHDVPQGRDQASQRSWDAYLDVLASFDFAPNRASLFSAHQMGSVRAGADPRRSACDPLGRVRSDTKGAVVRGLYVADGSLAPTAIGVNPMVTIMALAARVADAIDG